MDQPRIFFFVSSDGVRKEEERIRFYDTPSPFLLLSSLYAATTIRKANSEEEGGRRVLATQKKRSFYLSLKKSTVRL